jgi:thiamine biosynthesis protein ThiS
MKKFYLNGQEYKTSYPLTLLELIGYFDYKKSLLVIEYNNLICNYEHWNKITIQNEDKIEIVSIVGGG